MKRTVQINLGGVPFTIDDDAYRRLDAYLLELETYFAKSGSQEEIMTDIESRIAEILTDLTRTRQIVEINDVEATIKVMGTPTDFDQSADPAGATKDGPWDIKTGKRLFRNTDDKVIGGVCSGLAAYFGIEEVLWVRLAFVLVFLSLGFGIIVYLIMWALIPPAVTAADRLAMMGEPANAKNIGRMVERSIEDLSETIKHNWKQWHAKKRHRRDRSETPGHQDHPRYFLAAILVPVVLFARVVRIISRKVRMRRSAGMAYRPNEFV